MISQLCSSYVMGIRNWYSTDAQVSAQAKIELFKQDKFTLSTQVESLVSAMAQHAKPSTTIASSSLTSTAKAAINTAIASAWKG